MMRHMNLSRFSRRAYSFYMIAAAAIVIAMSGQSLANVEDVIEPERLASNELRGNLAGSGKQSYYYFIGGPGEVSVTLNLAASAGAVGVKVEFFDEDSKTVAPAIMAQATAGSSDAKAQKIMLAERKAVIIGVTDINSMAGSTGSYLLKLAGVVELSEQSKQSQPNPEPEVGSPYMQNTGQTEPQQQERPRFQISISTKKHGSFTFSFDLGKLKRVIQNDQRQP